MAGEIIALEIGRERSANVAFLFPIATPAKIGSTLQNVVPTPATENGVNVLPPALDAVLTVTEKAALDGGTLAVHFVTFRDPGGLTGAQLLARIRELYAASKTAFEADYSRRYGRIGDRFDVV